MKLKRDKMYELMNTYSEGNYNRFGKVLGVNPSQLHRCMTNDVGGGKKIIGAVMKFCISKGLKFEEYVDLTEEV